MPENPKPSWDAILRAPFADSQIFAKPRVWCGDCRSAQGRVCNRHHLLDPCPRCKQRITSAHVDLDYVGHADVTARLLDADPYWYWTPAYKDVPNDVLLAAIATGNSAIVAYVMDNAPPLFDRFGGMWGYLTIHDGEGNEVTRLGYGDASGKTGPDAVKEIVGDLLRNGAMRGGVALQLWSKEDRSSESPPVTEAKPAQDTATAEPEKVQINEDAQLLASLAHELVQQGVGVDELKAQVYDEAKHAHLLDKMVISPFTADFCKLSTVITAAKKTLQEASGEAEAGS